MPFFLAQIEVLSARHPFEDIFPLVLAAAMTGIFAVILAGQAQARISNRSKSAESLIGAAYLISTAGLVLVGDRVTQGAHDVANILFGNAVAIDSAHMIFLLAVCIPLFVLHLWYRRDLLFISFDPTMAATLKYPVVLLRIFLLVSLGIIISIGTRTIGALPVFSFSVLPAMAALILFENLKGSFFSAALFGGLSAFLGYFISFVFSFPTGACMTMTAAFILLIAKLVSFSRRN